MHAYINCLAVAAAVLFVNTSTATAHGEHHQQHTTIHSSHKYQKHEPLGLGYRTRYNTLKPFSAITTATSNQLYIGPPPPSSHIKSFEDSEFTTKSSSSTSSHHNDSIGGISFAKSKAQQQQSHTQSSSLPNNNNNDAIITIQSLIGINNHRIFTKTLRQTIGPPVNDKCDAASVIEPSAIPYADQSTTEGATSDFSTDSCGAGANTPGVWYSFTPTESGLYKTYVNSGLDLGIRIYSGDCSDGPVDLACVSQFNSLHTFIGVSGVNYKLLISEGRDGGGSGDSDGASFVFVLTDDDDTPFPSEAVANPPSQSPVKTRPPRPPANPVTNAPIATRPPKQPTPAITNAPVVQRPPKPTDKPVVVVEATPFPTASTPTEPSNNVGPAEINFIDLTTSISPNEEDLILVMEYEIGTNRQFETNLYQPDCETPLPSSIDITESPPTVTPKDDGVYDEVTLIYTINKASIGGNTLDLCVVFSLKDSEGISIIMEEKRQVNLKLSSEEIVITGAPVEVAAPTTPPPPVPVTTTNQPTRKPTPQPVPGMSCQVCAAGLTVPSSTPVGAGSKVCADLLVDAAAVLEGSSQCNAMAAAIPTCCPPTPPPVPVTNKPTSKPTSAQTRPPSGSASKPPSSYGWGGSGWQGGGSWATKPSPTSPSGWGGSGWQTNPPPTKPSWQSSSKKPSPSPTIKCTPQPSSAGWNDSSNNWHGYSGGSSSSSSDGWLFGSKSSKSRYDKCHNGWYSSSKSSKSSKSKGKSSKNGSWGGNGWYSGTGIQGVNQLDRIKVESNDAWREGRSRWYVGEGVVIVLISCLIMGLGVWIQ